MKWPVGVPRVRRMLLRLGVAAGLWVVASLGEWGLGGVLAAQHTMAMANGLWGMGALLLATLGLLVCRMVRYSLVPGWLAWTVGRRMMEGFGMEGFGNERETLTVERSAPHPPLGRR